MSAEQAHGPFDLLLLTPYQVTNRRLYVLALVWRYHRRRPSKRYDAVRQQSRARDWRRARPPV